jgi:glycosyltransferase involved in cell wall biosynthesis
MLKDYESGSLDIMPILTIGIPTYNRPDQLLETVLRLLPDLSREVSLLIVDNASDIPVSKVLAPIVRLDSSAIRIVRNKWNIGGPANVLRVIELCETDYLWILSDDDKLSPNCVKTVLDAVCEHREYDFFRFFSRETAKISEGEISTVVDLLHAVNSFGQLVWLSNCVFRVEGIRAHLRWAYQYLSSNAPQLVLQLMILRSSKRGYIARNGIVSYVKSAPDLAYDLVRVYAQFPLLLRLPLLWSEKCILASLLRSSGIPSPIRFAALLIRHARVIESKDLQVLYRSAWSDAILGGSLFLRIWVALAGLALWISRFSWAVGVTLRLAGRVSIAPAVAEKAMDRL